MNNYVQQNAIVNVAYPRYLIKNLRKKITLIIIGMFLLNAVTIAFMLIISSFVTLEPENIGELKTVNSPEFRISIPINWQQNVDNNVYSYVNNKEGSAVAEIYIIPAENPSEYFNSTELSVLKSMLSDNELLLQGNFVKKGSTNCFQVFEYTTANGSNAAARNCTIAENATNVSVQIAVQSKRDGSSVWYISRVVDWYWQLNRQSFREIATSWEVN